MVVFRVVYDLGNDIYDVVKSLHDIHHLRHKGVLSKPLNLNYKISSDDPWVNFDCMDDGRFSFQTHSLELGSDEACYWHLAGQRGDEAEFEGFTSYLSPKRRGSLRGYLSSKKDHHELGISARNGRVNKVLTQEQMSLGSLALLHGMFREIEILNERDKVHKE